MLVVSGLSFEISDCTLDKALCLQRVFFVLIFWPQWGQAN